MKDVLAAVKAYKFLAAIVLIVVVALGWMAAYLPKPTYQATSILVASPAGNNADYNSVTNVQFILPALVQQVGTETFRFGVLKAVHLPTLSSNVSISASQDQGSGIVRITSSSPNPSVVIAVANAAATHLAASKLLPTVKLTLLEGATSVSSSTISLRKPILAAAFVLGLLAAIFVSLGANALRSEAVSEDDLPRLGLEMLGEIPKQRLGEASIIQIFSDSSLMEFSESFHKLVANLQAAELVSPGSQVAVVSCTGGDGKTTVAAGLAYALALNGAQVVAIDADLRRANLLERFGLTRTARRGPAPLEPAAQVTPLAGLRVVPASLSDQHPAKTIASTLPSLLAKYDDCTVVVDSPPLLPVPEATLVAHIVSRVLIVIEPGSTELSGLERVLHDLRRSNVEVVGAVLNRVPALPRSHRYGAYYGAVTFAQPAYTPAPAAGEVAAATASPVRALTGMYGAQDELRPKSSKQQPSQQATPKAREAAD